MRLIAWTLLLSLLLWGANTTAAYGDVDFWTPIGPYGGDIFSFAIDPRTPAIVYAGAANGGLFKTTDGGRSWLSFHLGLEDSSVIALAVDPSDPNTVYAGTENGVFKTTNGGASWRAVSFGLHDFPPVVTSLAVDPVTPGTVYAGVFVNGRGGGVFKTTNGGTSWAAVGLTDLEVFTVAIDPKTPSTVYAGATNSFSEDGSGSGVYKSVDGGASWHPANTGLNFLFVRNRPFVEDLAIDPTNPVTLYAATPNGVYKSTNGAASWQASSSGLPAGRVLRVKVSPVTPSILYVVAEDSRIFTVSPSTEAGHGRRPPVNSQYAFSPWPSTQPHRRPFTPEDSA